jgi:hypothetical protein
MYKDKFMSRLYYMTTVNGYPTYGYTDNGFTNVTNVRTFSNDPRPNKYFLQKTETDILYTGSNNAKLYLNTNGFATNAGSLLLDLATLPNGPTNILDIDYDGGLNKLAFATNNGVWVSNDFGQTATLVAGTENLSWSTALLKPNGAMYIFSEGVTANKPIAYVNSSNELVWTLNRTSLPYPGVPSWNDFSFAGYITCLFGASAGSDVIFMVGNSGKHYKVVASAAGATVSSYDGATITGFGSSTGRIFSDGSSRLFLYRRDTANSIYKIYYSDDFASTWTASTINGSSSLSTNFLSTSETLINTFWKLDASTNTKYLGAGGFSSTGFLSTSDNGASITYSTSIAIKQVTTKSSFVANNAPTDISLSSSSIAENSSVGSVVGTLSATDAEGGAMVFSLVAGAGSTDNSSFSISGNQLLTAVALNYESKSSYSIRIRATDSTNLTYEEAFTINVTNVNEAPNSLALSSSSIAENNAINAVIGTLSSTDPEGSAITYSVLGTDAASFNINGNELRASVVFNYEAKSLYSIVIRATDGVNNTDQAYTISVTDVNEAPASISLSANYIAERNNINAVIGTLSATDQDGNVITWSLSGDDAASFNISSNQLRASEMFNYGVKSSYSITVRATDSVGLYSEQAFTISILQRISIPTLSMSSVSEKKGINTVVGTLSSVEPNGLPVTYSLQSGGEYFNIFNNQLRTSESFDHNERVAYSIVVRASSSIDYAENTFEIQITNTSYSTNNFDTSYWKVESGSLSTGGMIGSPTTAFLFDPNVMDANGINKDSVNLGPAQFLLFQTEFVPPDCTIPNANNFLLSNWTAKGWGNTVEEVVGAFNSFIAAAFINSSQALAINPWSIDLSSYIVIGNVGGTSYVAPYLCYASQGSS